MLLKDTFEKDIYREIDPVVKANSTDHLQNELEEFVITNEVKSHLLRFFDDYNDPDAVVNGVWISGFFGSGKSHLLKMLAVALEERDVNGRSAMEYLVEKASDTPALSSAMQRACELHPSESVLFNIDSYAPNTGHSDSGSLLAAFIKAFNHHCGYFDGDQQHVAKLEYDLDREGVLDVFKEQIQQQCGKPWNDVRKSALLYKRQITSSFDKALGNPEGTTLDALGYYKDTYKPDIKSFAERVRDYINAHGPGFRLNFFVDEVGQFIAKNTELMINLQSIAEELNIVCGRSSWIIVTSQENMEDVVGQLDAHSSNDFSKIQARFGLKMTLSSSDAKEVIRDRLLAKRAQDAPAFHELYEANRSDFNILFDFPDGAKTYKPYADFDEFLNTYPFVPYQFEIFMTSLRGLSSHNCFTGRHNSTGARSMLGVFQMVAQHICDEGANIEEGTLASYDLMFEGLRNDLKSEVYAEISTAEDQLDDPIAVRLLKALLLVKYCKDFRATPGNLRVLLYGAFSESTSELNQKVKESLDLLERQVYIRRNGNTYEYLTDDEKEVEQEIKNTVVSESDMHDTLSQLFHDVCGATKVTYKNGSFSNSYNYNLLIDGEMHGQKHYDLSVDLLTAWTSEGSLTSVVPSAPKTLTIALQNSGEFLLELRRFRQTERYCNINSSSDDIRSSILLDKQKANGKRYIHLRDELRDLLSDALFSAAGVDITDRVTGTGKDAVESAALELVKRSYSGLQQIGQNITDNDVYNQCLAGQQLFSELPEYCKTVLARIKMLPGPSTVAGDGTGSLTAYFTKNEYGWPEIAVRSAVATLYAAGKLEVRKAGSLYEGANLADALKRKRDLDKLTVTAIEELSPEQMAEIAKTFRDVTGTSPKLNDVKNISDELVDFTKSIVTTMTSAVSAVKEYPFKDDFNDKLEKIEECAKNAADRSWVINQFPGKAVELAEAKDDLTKMKAFVDGSPMRDIWRSLKKFLDGEAHYLDDLGIDNKDVEQIEDAVKDPKCYKSGLIPPAHKLAKNLHNEFMEKMSELKENKKDALNEYRSTYDSMISKPGVTEENRQHFASVFEDAAANLDAEENPLRVLNFVENFKGKYAESLLDLLTPKPAPEPETVTTSSDNEEKVQNQTPKPEQEKISVGISELDVSGYKLPAITTAEEEDAYLEALRKAIDGAIEEGKKIIL
jgi:hypothetical protein